MVIIKVIVGVVVALAIIVCLMDWESREENLMHIFVLIILTLIEVIIIKG